MAEIRADELQVGDRLMCVVEAVRDTSDSVTVALRVPGVAMPVQTVLLPDRRIDVRG